MSKLYSAILKFVPALLLFSFISPRASAQATYSLPRIAAAVNDAQVTVLRGNTHPLARAEFDRGPAPANLPMQHMLMVLQRSPAQETALESFMAEQLDRSSPNYHHWLTAAEFGQMYGPAQQDIDTITKWLVRRGFQVNSVATGRITIDFSGTAAQVQTAFHTTIHQYNVKGEQHWANSSDPSIPTALIPVVAGIRSLHNFYPKPTTHLRRASSVRGAFTFNNGSACDIAGDSDNCYAVGPNDFATIYSVQTLWNDGITGAGVTIGIVGDSDINLSDVAQFRTLFGLPANVPHQIYPTGSSPGKNSDEIETALDAEWAGAVAENATIDLVLAPSTNTTFGGDTAANYIVNCQVAAPMCTQGTVPAKILSESFGECELGLGTGGNTMYNMMWQMAATDGITVLVSSGDNGSASCDIDEVNGPISQPASNGLQVNGIASTPYNVAVGGTDFDDLGTESTYWNQSNAAGTQTSAMKYVPESTWNDTCTNAQVFPLIGANPPVTDPVTSCSNLSVQQAGLVQVTGGSGGESNCTTSNGNTPSSCSVGNTRPAWQTAAGTPGTTRDLPDVSLFAGDGFAGSFYVMCDIDSGSVASGGQGGQPCTLGTTPNFVGVGGTSVSVQAFAGMMALVEQKTGSSQGNASSVLYALAASQNPATCNSTAAGGPGPNCYFNDVTVGTNAMPCAPGSLDCSTTASVPPAGRIPQINVRAVRIICALCIGLLFLLVLRRKSQRWVTSTATCGAVLLLVVSVGCGGGNGGQEGGNGPGTPEGVMMGYSAGLGYDLATGLGSVNASNVVNAPGWAGAPPIEPPPVATNRPILTVPAATIAVACALCLALLWAGLRRKQIRWSTVVLLLAFALSILSAARSNAATHAGKSTQRPAAFMSASAHR